MSRVDAINNLEKKQKSKNDTYSFYSYKTLNKFKAIIAYPYISLVILIKTIKNKIP